MAAIGEDLGEGPKVHPPYEPPKSYKLSSEIQPLLEEASLPNRELWLLRFPVNEISLKELGNKQWDLRTNVTSGRIGHFEDSEGNRYDLVRHDIEGSRKFAYVPTTSNTIIVREIPVEVSIVKNLRPSQPRAEAEQPAPSGAHAAAAAAENGAEIPNERGNEVPSVSQEPEKSGVTKESSKHSSKKRRRASSDAGSLSEAETVQKSGVSSAVETVSQKKSKS